MDEAVGCFYDTLCGAIVLLQFKKLCSCEQFLEVQDVVDSCTSESIYALCIITHDTYLSIFHQLQENLLLYVVGVLILIHKNEFVL